MWPRSVRSRVGSTAVCLPAATSLQLRELALLNGTLKDDQPCFICGELGR